MINIRKTVHSLLMGAEAEGRFVNLLLSSPELSAATREERAAVTSLLYTTVENKLRYDYIIGALADRRTEDIDPYVLAVLRIGMCQILDMRSVPDYAAVNESVKLARHGGERAFINGVLRSAVRCKDAPPMPDRAKNEIRYLSVYYSVPRATVKLLAARFGTEATEAMLKSFSEHSTTGITVNLAKTDREALLLRLAASGIDARASEYSKSGIIIKDAGAVTELPGFAEGELFVQDEASRIAAAALDAWAGHTVVDVCAAPGGKTFAAAMAVGDSGRVYSFDIHASKLSLIESGAQRLGFKNVSVAERDACVPCEELFGKADRVICDAPCSGLGVIGKKPDLRYKDFAAVSAELVPLQAQILECSARYVKDGGVLVYSTCTLTEAENEGITDAFLAAHPEFSYEGFSAGDISAAEGHITLLPHIHGTDGFYIAKLRKVKNDG